MKRALTRTKIEWAQIPGFDGYLVSSDGEILSLLRQERMILRQRSKQTGYRYVILYRDRKKHKKYIHTLVLLAFVGSPQKGQETRHLDGNPANNSRSNLRWGTRRENQKDKVRHGRILVGESCPNHKLTVADVRRIRQLYGHHSLRELGSMFMVSHTTIRKAALGIKWSSVREGIADGTN